MAKQKGFVQLSGTIGGINFYFRNGKAVARAAGGGFNSESIRKSPKMVRTRENSSEFGMVSKTKKAIRIGLLPFLNTLKDLTLHGRMMSLLQTIKTYDTVSPRGERSVGIALQTPMGKKLLKEFNFSEKKVSTVLGGKMNFDEQTTSLTVTDFDIKTVSFPYDATIMEVQFGVLRFDSVTLETQLFMSESHFISSTDTLTDFSMTPSTTPTGNGIFIAVAGVRFYQEVGGERYLIKTLGEQSVEVVGV